jgi:hypothetical protein
MWNKEKGNTSIWSVYVKVPSRHGHPTERAEVWLDQRGQRETAAKKYKRKRLS